MPIANGEISGTPGTIPSTYPRGACAVSRWRRPPRKLPSVRNARFQIGPFAFQRHSTGPRFTHGIEFSTTPEAQGTRRKAC